MKINLFSSTKIFVFVVVDEKSTGAKVSLFRSVSGPKCLHTEITPWKLMWLTYSNAALLTSHEQVGAIVNHILISVYFRSLKLLRINITATVSNISHWKSSASLSDCWRAVFVHCSSSSQDYGWYINDIRCKKFKNLSITQSKYFSGKESGRVCPSKPLRALPPQRRLFSEELMGEKAQWFSWLEEFRRNIQPHKKFFCMNHPSCDEGQSDNHPCVWVGWTLILVLCITAHACMHCLLQYRISQCGVPIW